MLNPHIDLTEEFRFVGEYSLPSGEYGGSYKTILPFKSDVCLVQIDMSAGGGNWHRAGYVRQLWNTPLSQYPASIASQRVWLRQLNLFKLEPVAESEIVFTAVNWLVNWRVKLWSRLDENSSVTVEDILITIDEKQNEILVKLNSLTSLQNQSL